MMGKWQLNVTVNLYPDPVAANAGNRIYLSETIEINVNSFSEITSITDRFHSLAEKIRKETIDESS